MATVLLPSTSHAQHLGVVDALDAAGWLLVALFVLSLWVPNLLADIWEARR